MEKIGQPLTLIAPQEDGQLSTNNPLLIDVVLECIFKHLHVSSLKVCRLVCRKWNKIATTQLLHQAFFQHFYERVLLLNKGNFHLLSQFVNSTASPSSFHNLHIRGLNCMKLYRELNLIGPQLKRLKFYKTSFETEKESICGLLKLLTDHFNPLPNLQSLYIDVTNDERDNYPYDDNFNDYNNHHYYNNYNDNNDQAQRRLHINDNGAEADDEESDDSNNREVDDRHINIFSESKLKRLFFMNHPYSHNNNNYYNNRRQSNSNYYSNIKNGRSNKTLWEERLLEKFQRLKELHLRSFDAISKRTLEDLIQIPWHLSKFKVTVDNRVPPELMRAFLLKIKDTLTALSISFSFNYEGYNYDVSNPTEDNWLIPLGLARLKKLKIETERSNDVNTLVRSLVAALQLPALRVIKLYGECVEGSYGHMTFPRLWDLQNATLKEVKLGAHFLDTSVFLRPIQVWPNLTELTLYFPSIEIVASVLMTLDQQLERFHLELKNDKGVDWESVLTGTPTREKKNFINFSLPSSSSSSSSLWANKCSSRASIRNFKYLKCLKIEFPEFSPEFYFTDFFLYNGLVYLKELQFLYIRGEKFSLRALEDLKKELRPLANISLVKYESMYDEEDRIEIEDLSLREVELPCTGA